VIAGSMIGHILHTSLLYALYWMARKSVLIALLLGTVVSFSARFVRHSLPLHVSIFNIYEKRALGKKISETGEMKNLKLVEKHIFPWISLKRGIKIYKQRVGRHMPADGVFGVFTLNIDYRGFKGFLRSRLISFDVPDYTTICRRVNKVAIEKKTL